MKKSTRTLVLRAQTIRLFANDALRAAVGGLPGPVEPEGFIMKDSVIVPTSRR